jgi:N-methylhydantoinase A
VLNALLTDAVPTTAVVTTTGFRDVLEIMRADRKDLFDLHQSKPVPLVARDRRLEVDERIAADGTIITALESADLDKLVSELKALEVEAVAVCFLFSFVEPAHEIAVGEAIAAALPNVHVSLSHQVLPLYREYERTATTVVNAAAQPVMTAYLADVLTTLRAQKLGGEFFVMQSNGGLATPAEATDRPVFSLFSGPAGGVVAAAEFGRRHDISNLLSLDMGGTSSDVAAVTNGKPDRVIGIEIGGYPIAVPSLDIVSVGAGGGSIAWLDDGGALQVGPQSSGADPGPACYGNGGEDPTVTDAAVVLNRYSADSALGGTLRVKPKLAKAAIAKLADKLGMSIDDTAWGIMRLVNANMANAVREVSVERGRDPRDYALFASGGGGPAHGWDVALELGITQLLIPPFPGAASAHGMLMSDLRVESVRTVHRTLAEVDRAALEKLLLELSGEGAARLPQGSENPSLEARYQLDLRYRGQTYELEIPVDIDNLATDGIADAFHQAHHARYGHALPDGEVELVHARASSVIPRERLAGSAPQWPGSQETGTRSVYWGPERGWLDTAIASRSTLQEAGSITGPAIVQQADSTLVLPPGVLASALADGCLVLQSTETKT